MEIPQSIPSTEQDLIMKNWQHFHNGAKWWRHQMETFSALLALWAENSSVSGDFPSQRPVTRNSDVFFDLHLNKPLSKQSWGLWFEMPLRSLWRHCNAMNGNRSVQTANPPFGKLVAWVYHKEHTEFRLAAKGVCISKQHLLLWCIILKPSWAEFVCIYQKWCDAAERNPHFIVHDDVIKWKHFPRNWPFVRGIHRSPVNSLHKGQWRRAFMFSLICARINGSVNNGEAGDLRRYRAHYDVIVMENKDPFILQSQYHCCWWPGVARRQGISSKDSVLILPDY